MEDGTETPTLQQQTEEKRNLSNDLENETGKQYDEQSEELFTAVKEGKHNKTQSEDTREKMKNMVKEQSKLYMLNKIFQVNGTYGDQSNWRGKVSTFDTDKDAKEVLRIFQHNIEATNHSEFGSNNALMDNPEVNLYEIMKICIEIAISRATKGKTVDELNDSELELLMEIYEVQIAMKKKDMKTILILIKGNVMKMVLKYCKQMDEKNLRMLSKITLDVELNDEIERNKDSLSTGLIPLPNGTKKMISFMTQKGESISINGQLRALEVVNKFIFNWNSLGLDGGMRMKDEITRFNKAWATVHKITNELRANDLNHQKHLPLKYNTLVAALTVGTEEESKNYAILQPMLAQIMDDIYKSGGDDYDKMGAELSERVIHLDTLKLGLKPMKSYKNIMYANKGEDKRNEEHTGTNKSWQQLCGHTMRRGKCTRHNCTFTHVTKEQWDKIDACHGDQKGKCKIGFGCRYHHKDDVWGSKPWKPHINAVSKDGGAAEDEDSEESEE
jgi:hypothetical protein